MTARAARGGWWCPAALLCAIAWGGCGGASSPRDATPDPGQDGALDLAPDASKPCPAVVREYREIAGEPAPPNPVTGDATPDEYDRVRFLRFRAGTGDAPPAEVHAILIVLPGFTVGSGYLTYLARSLVSLTCGAVEVWLPERRHHLIEDPTGMIAAEEAGDPRVAHSYYYEGAEVGGRTFAGFLDDGGPDSAMRSERGLDIAMKDVRSVIRQVPEEARRATVFLGGQSRGVGYVKAYAAYVFDDGRQGVEDLAGLVLIDGDTQDNSALDEAGYLAGLDDIRKGKKSRFVTVPPTGPPIYTFLEILAMAASDGVGDPADPELGPGGQWKPMGPLAPILPLLFRLQDIRMTNEALLGFAVDTDSAVLDIIRGGSAPWTVPRARTAPACSRATPLTSTAGFTGTRSRYASPARSRT